MIVSLVMLFVSTNNSSIAFQKHVYGGQHIESSLRRSQRSRNILISGRSMDIAFSTHHFMPVTEAASHSLVWFILDCPIIRSSLVDKIRKLWHSISLGVEGRVVQIPSTYSCWMMLWIISMKRVEIAMSRIWRIVSVSSNSSPLVNRSTIRPVISREEAL